MEIKCTGIDRTEHSKIQEGGGRQSQVEESVGNVFTGGLTISENVNGQVNDQ